MNQNLAANIIPKKQMRILNLAKLNSDKLFEEDEIAKIHEELIELLSDIKDNMDEETQSLKANYLMMMLLGFCLEHIRAHKKTSQKEYILRMAAMMTKCMMVPATNKEVCDEVPFSNFQDKITKYVQQGMNFIQ
jgi:hypothetical protein